MNFTKKIKTGGNRSTLFYIVVILFFYSCKAKVETTNIQKIALHTFTGKGEHDKTTNWFYIKNVADRGFSGYYFESDSRVSDFKDAHFVYSKTRPPAFDGQYASEEKIELLDPADLPDTILTLLPNLEFLYIKK